MRPRIRWRFLLICAGVAFVTLNGIMLISAALGPSVSISMQPGFWGFLVVIILTSPLQATAEEVSHIGGETVPLDLQELGRGMIGYYTRKPAGIVIATSPDWDWLE